MSWAGGAGLLDEEGMAESWEVRDEKRGGLEEEVSCEMGGRGWRDVRTRRCLCVL